MATITHGRTAKLHDLFVINLLGVNTSAAVTVTAHTSPTLPFIVTNHAVSSGFLVQTATYSYDGVIHANEAYRGDF